MSTKNIISNLKLNAIRDIDGYLADETTDFVVELCKELRFKKSVRECLNRKFKQKRKRSCKSPKEIISKAQVSVITQRLNSFVPAS